jgi:hypothetical protein
VPHRLAFFCAACGRFDAAADFRNPESEMWHGQLSAQTGQQESLPAVSVESRSAGAKLQLHGLAWADLRQVALLRVVKTCSDACRMTVEPVPVQPVFWRFDALS